MAPAPGWGARPGGCELRERLEKAGGGGRAVTGDGGLQPRGVLSRVAMSLRGRGSPCPGSRAAGGLEEVSEGSRGLREGSGGAGWRWSGLGWAVSASRLFPGAHSGLARLRPRCQSLLKHLTPLLEAEAWDPSGCSLLQKRAQAPAGSRGPPPSGAGPRGLCSSSASRSPGRAPPR